MIFPINLGASIATIAFEFAERASRRYSSTPNRPSIENDGARYMTCSIPLILIIEDDEPKNVTFHTIWTPGVG